ncbi:MAG TPA: hypothetical protein VF060_11765 [Trebonia sp.]
MSEIEYATAEDDAEEVPDDQRCVWPGCRRRRAPGRPGGSGRQKEYCLKADRPENGGGPVHNARNRWAWHRKETGASVSSGSPAGEAGTDPEEAGRSVRQAWPVSAARQRVSDLLDQARRQHAAALTAFTAERDLYAQVAGQFEVLADPAALDLELTAAGVRAGRDVAAAAEEASRAQRAQRAAERDRDDAVRRAAEADAAAEQFAADTEAAENAAAEAEQVLAERTAEFDRARGELALRTREAETKADEADARAAAAKAAADQAVTDSRARADKAAADAREQIARIGEEAAEQVTTAQAEARRARQQADEVAAGARREVTATREAAERARRETEAVRRDAETAREAAQARILTAETAAATSSARAAAVEEEIARLRDELRQARERHSAEVTRLEAAHQSAVGSEKARADRAETELDALRAAGLEQQQNG